MKEIKEKFKSFVDMDKQEIEEFKNKAIEMTKNNGRSLILFMDDLIADLDNIEENIGSYYMINILYDFSLKELTKKVDSFVKQAALQFENIKQDAH